MSFWQWIDHWRNLPDADIGSCADRSGPFEDDDPPQQLASFELYKTPPDDASPNRMYLFSRTGDPEPAWTICGAFTFTRDRDAELKARLEVPHMCKCGSAALYEYDAGPSLRVYRCEACALVSGTWLGAIRKLTPRPQ